SARGGVQPLRDPGEEPARLLFDRCQDLTALGLEIPERALGARERLPRQQTCSVVPQIAHPAPAGRLQSADGCPDLLQGETGRRITHADFLLPHWGGALLSFVAGGSSNPVVVHIRRCWFISPSPPRRGDGGWSKNRGPRGAARSEQKLLLRKTGFREEGKGEAGEAPRARKCKTLPRPTFGQSSEWQSGSIASSRSAPPC